MVQIRFLRLLVKYSKDRKGKLATNDEHVSAYMYLRVSYGPYQIS
jgi:hypothetical protein